MDRATTSSCRRRQRLGEYRHYDWASIILRCAPYYFVRSGRLIVVTNSMTGNLWIAGEGGFVWPSRAAIYTSKDTARSYWLQISISEVQPSRDGNRYNGFPLRCLSTVIDI